jgi:two-component system alkaline phosphatase synthesis response regulator PhoP
MEVSFGWRARSTTEVHLASFFQELIKMTKILIVEDDSSIALGVKNLLADEGYDAKLATDGDVGLKLASTELFDLIILDVVLPKMDGYQVSKALRKRRVKTPILMLSARAAEAEKVVGLDSGADDYLAKPFGSMEFLARVRAMLRRARSEGPEIFRFGKIEVNFDKKEVRRGGRSIELTRLEFETLCILIHSGGRLLSRRQLIDAVWGDSVAVTEGVVNNHIMNLRKKIEDDPQHPLHLRSVRGFGYRFNAD